jgi:hypothetical protein
VCFKPDKAAQVKILFTGQRVAMPVEVSRIIDHHSRNLRYNAAQVGGAVLRGNKKLRKSH